MPRSKRQNKILELIKERDIETQDDLALALTSSGFPTTQATISRDIKELGLIKSTYGGGRQRYEVGSSDIAIDLKIVALFKAAAMNVDCAQNIVVVRTIVGGANSVGLFVDKLNGLNVLGCVAGDDTVMIICRTTEDAKKLVETLKEALW